ncbi:MAG: DMT family transporter [Terriglobia bacterium]
MPIWMSYALLTLVLWGFTGLTQKLATNYISVEFSLILFSAAFVPIAVVILIFQPLDWKIPAMAWFLAILGGALNGLGVLTSMAAFHHGGKASVVTPLIALYPVVTVALAVPFLHEKISHRELAGIILALVATAALSYGEETPAGAPDTGGTTAPAND